MDYVRTDMKASNLSVVPKAVAVAAMAIGASATVLGLTQQDWPGVLPFASEEAFYTYVTFLLVAAILVALGARFGRRSPIAAGVVLAATVVLVSGALWPVAVALWFALSSILLGRFVLSLLRIENIEADFTVYFLAGAGVNGTAVGLLAHLPLNYPGVYGLALATPLLIWWRQAVQIAIQARVWFGASQGPERVDWLGVAIAVIALVHFVVTLMPEVMFDALILHLLVPAHLTLRHQWGFDPSLYAMALIPMLGNWLFSIGYMLAGETGARLINLGFTYLLAWQVREVVLWAGGKARGAKWASLLFLATPLSFLETSSLFVESIFSAFVVAGIMAVLRVVSSSPEGRETDLKTGGFMLGLAAATKAVALSILPALLILLLFRWRDWANRPFAPAVLIGLLLFLAFGGVPYVSAWLIAENPIHPFFNGLFKSMYFPHTNFDNALFKSGATWDLPYRVAFDSAKYLEATNGASGFQWLLLLPVAVVILTLKLYRRALLLFAITVFSIVLIFHSQSYLRYIYWASALLTALIGVAFSSTSASNVLIRVFAFLAGFTLILNLLFFPAAGWTYRDMPLKILLGEPFRSQYLEARLPIRKAVEFVNYLNVGQSPVAFFSQPFGAGLNADALYPNWYNYRFQEGIESARDERGVVSRLSQYGANFVLLDSMWGAAEKRSIIEQATRGIAEFGSVSVRSVREEYLFSEELLRNAELSGPENWTLGSGVKVDTGTFTVTVSETATQVVKVRGGVRYRNEVTVRCPEAKGQARLQVNWHDAQMEFITASIQIFDCAHDWQDHRQTITTPKHAAFGIVYGASHTSSPVEITRISLR